MCLKINTCENQCVVTISIYNMSLVITGLNCFHEEIYGNNQDLFCRNILEKYMGCLYTMF